MNRREFMEQLERLLSDIPQQEREEALEYYRNYFDDAGEENEDEVIRELGSPGKVAAIIKADLKSSGQDFGDFTDTGYEDSRFEERQVPKTRRRPYREKQPRKRGGLLLLIILAVFLFPFWGGIGAGIIGVILGILGGIIGILVGSLGAGIGLFIAGIALIVVGMIELAGSIALGLALFGTGMILIALGILFLMAFSWLAFTVFPKLFRVIVDRSQRIFHRRKGERTV